jgi:hypothetical protein
MCVEQWREQLFESMVMCLFWLIGTLRVYAFGARASLEEVWSGQAFGFWQSIVVGVGKEVVVLYVYDVGVAVLVYHGGSGSGQAFGFWHGIHLGVARAIGRAPSGRMKT